jgi:hypothetical protein
LRLFAASSAREGPGRLPGTPGGGARGWGGPRLGGSLEAALSFLTREEAISGRLEGRGMDAGPAWPDSRIPGAGWGAQLESVPRLGGPPLFTRPPMLLHRRRLCGGMAGRGVVLEGGSAVAGTEQVAGVGRSAGMARRFRTLGWAQSRRGGGCRPASLALRIPGAGWGVQLWQACFSGWGQGGAHHSRSRERLSQRRRLCGGMAGRSVVWLRAGGLR